MWVVIFRARAGQQDDEYLRRAQQMRNKALAEYGCLDFVSMGEGVAEISLSYWPDLESIHAWRADAEHQQAQQLGRARWYSAYTVEVAHIQRRYEFPASET